MRRTTLIVHDFSQAYVGNFVRYLHQALRRHADPEAELVFCKSVDDAAHGPGLVFIIGEKFPPFRRRPGCVYAYLNLSVVSRLGSPLAASVKGHRLILQKRQLLNAKLDLVDVVLDYYAPQTEVLSRQLPVPVMGFDYAVDPSRTGGRREVLYDVCFVGGLSERRQTVLDGIAARGFTLSPSSGAPIESIAAASACCLNVHVHRSNHLEIPRIVAALANGCPVVTETSHGIAGLGAGEFVTERPLAALAGEVERRLGDREALADLGLRSVAWYRDSYLPRAEARWREICRSLAEFPLAA
ncbi:MAG: hypothetical protein QNJ13_00665 [Paracoccaceae bacterium]|nr:hypothetical protein [Paracoccaceae bacterium]